VERPATLTRAVALANATVVIMAMSVLWLLPPAHWRHERAGDAQPGRARHTAAPPSAAPLPSVTPSPPVTATVASARKAKANELGLVPVIMYHRVMKKRQASIDRTPGQLRDELEKLAKQHYVPVTAADYVAGHIDIPAGTHPVVLTFDDGWANQFTLNADGTPKKNTAAAILIEVAAKHPGFRPVATFWVNHDPFGLHDRAEQRRAVRWLTERGFEVANHSYHHRDLRRMKKKKVKEEIVREERLLRALGTGPSTTFALPYGSEPRSMKVAREGSWDGTHYHFAGVFLAGATPAASPYGKDFDPLRIPRIQSNGTKGECRKWCSTYWLRWLDKHPGQRYTADGDPRRISIPKKLRGNISAKRGEKVVAY
jgi:peptidoglycan/xylan/chitin deacetylase (PgdA/CDA1 family)